MAAGDGLPLTGGVRQVLEREARTTPATRIPPRAEAGKSPLDAVAAAASQYAISRCRVGRDAGLRGPRGAGATALLARVAG